MRLVDDVTSLEDAAIAIEHWLANLPQYKPNKRVMKYLSHFRQTLPSSNQRMVAPTPEELGLLYRLNQAFFRFRRNVRAVLSRPAKADSVFKDQGERIALVPTLPESSINLCLTSPPYAMQRKRLGKGITADYFAGF
jgi:hypothetical protein